MEHDVAHNPAADRRIDKYQKCAKFYVRRFGLDAGTTMYFKLYGRTEETVVGWERHAM